MKIHGFPVFLSVGFIAVLGLGACAHDTPCATPEPLVVNLRASSQLNPGEAGESLATVVRLYQLKDIRKFTEAGFDELLDRDREVLGEDLLGSREITLAPGDVQEPALERQAQAQFIGVVALYRQPAGNLWRVAKRLPAPNPRFCHDKKNKKRPPAASLFLKDSRIESRS